MSVILPCPRTCGAGASLTVVFSQSLHQILEQKKEQVEHCHCKHFNIPPSHLSPPSSFSVCHPPSTRPPARLLLQTQLRGRLDPGEPPPPHTGVSPGDHSSSSVLASLPSSLRLLFNITLPFLIFHPLDLRSLSSFPWNL